MEWDNLDIFDDCSDVRSKSVTVSDGRPSIKGFGSSRRSSALFRQDKRPKCETTEVALSESPLIKPKQISDSFEGFSIIKNRVPSAVNSPFSKSDDLIRHFPRPRSSSSGGRLFPGATPQSPHEYHTPMSYPSDPEKYLNQIQALKDELSERDALVQKLQADLVASQTVAKNAQEEANTNKFMCSLQEQRIDELEQHVSQARLDQNEALSDKSRKHRQIIKKLNQERAAYEERADSMIKQMNEQMTQLQQMAMSRIETLESELMAQRHSNDKLQAECTRLHACAAAAMASATKNRQLAASLKSASPGSVRKSLFSPNGTLKSGDMAKMLRKESRSSTGTNSTYASTQLHDDDADAAEEEEEEDGEEDGEDDDEDGSGTEIDENESRSNTPTASPARSPNRTKLSSSSPSKSSNHKSTAPAGSLLEEEVWATQI